MEISTSFTFFKHGKILIAKLQREKDMFLVEKYKKKKITNYKQGKNNHKQDKKKCKQENTKGKEMCLVDKYK